MDSLHPSVLVLLAGGVLVAYAVRRYLAFRYVRKVRGPPSSSWLLGELTR